MVDEPPPGARTAAAYGAYMEDAPGTLGTFHRHAHTHTHTDTSTGLGDGQITPDASDDERKGHRLAGGVYTPPEQDARVAHAYVSKDAKPVHTHIRGNTNTHAPEAAYSSFRTGFAPLEFKPSGQVLQDAWRYVAGLYQCTVGNGSGLVSGNMRATAHTSDASSRTFLDLMERFEVYVPLAVWIIALCTRYYRLDVPPGVVFDETHFGRFTNQYTAGTYLFDIHPPLAKLIFWFAGKVIGYDNTVCKYSNIAEDYSPECKFIFLRIVAAFFGSATAPIVYLITRNWGASIYGALLASFFFIFDNLNLIESRLILTDSQLMFWIAVALLSAQYWWARLNAHADAETAFFTRYGQEYNGSDSHRLTDARFMSNREHLGWLVWMGIACANAIAVKWTGLATPGMIAVESFFAFYFLRRPVKLHDGLVIAGVAFIVYAWYFWCHFALLPLTGDGDGFMRIEFQRTLVGNGNYDPAAVRPPFLVNFFQLNREMLSANARISQRHHWESVWWEWPLNLRGLLYYSKDLGHTYTRTVYLLGNPAVIWLVFAFLLVTAACLGIYYRFRRFGGTDFSALEKWAPTLSRATYCLITYVLNLLPYVAVTRSCFIYHYMPALLYGEIMTALVIDALAGRKYIGQVFRVVMLVVVVVWLFYAPWVYAFALTNDGHARRRWMPRWD